MPTLHVCPLSRPARDGAATGQSHVVTLINQETIVERPVLSIPSGISSSR